MTFHEPLSRKSWLWPCKYYTVQQTIQTVLQHENIVYLCLQSCFSNLSASVGNWHGDLGTYCATWHLSEHLENEDELSTKLAQMINRQVSYYIVNFLLRIIWNHERGTGCYIELHIRLSHRHEQGYWKQWKLKTETGKLK